MVAPFLADNRVRFVRSDTRLGIGGNWNACLRQATSDIILFLFQDDLWEPGVLTTVRKAFLEHPSAGLISLAHDYRFEGAVDHAPYERVIAAVRDIPRGFHRGRDILRRWLGTGLKPNIIGEPSFVALRRSVVETTGPFAEDMPQFLDADMWTRCLLHGDWVFIAERCGTFRVHGGGASAQNDASGSGVADRLRAFERLIARLPHGDLRREATHARNRALDDMAMRYLERRRSGKNTIGVRGGAVRTFALRHPFLLLRAFLRALSGRVEAAPNAA